VGRIAIFGATSGIARAVCAEWTRRGRDLVLMGRDEKALAELAADLEIRGGRACSVFRWDLLERENHAARFSELAGRFELDGLFFAPGVLLPEAELEADAAKTRLLFDVNLTETVVVLNLFAVHFRAANRGFLSVLSSVAGDRGRVKNRTYGASKAGLSAFLQGLRGALHAHGVLVQTVKPGPVATPMLAGYKGPSLILAMPETVARDIVNALERGKTTVYTPGYWRLIMAVIRALPEAVLRRLPV
jgi:short-subunit dehydrogenase